MKFVVDYIICVMDKVFDDFVGGDVSVEVNRKMFGFI